MYRSGIIAVLLLLAALLGLAVFVAMRGQPSRYGEVVLSPEFIEVKDSPDFDPATGRQFMAKQLLVDGIAHGTVFPDEWSRLATTYYHRDGPVGRVLERFNWFPGPENTYAADARLPAALVGLAAAGWLVQH